MIAYNNSMQDSVTLDFSSSHLCLYQTNGAKSSTKKKKIAQLMTTYKKFSLSNWINSTEESWVYLHQGLAGTSLYILHPPIPTLACSEAILGFTLVAALKQDIPYAASPGYFCVGSLWVGGQVVPAGTCRRCSPDTPSASEAGIQSLFSGMTFNCLKLENMLCFWNLLLC